MIPFFGLDEFVKFDDFDWKLEVPMKWLDGCKLSPMPTCDYLCKIYISPVMSFYIDV